MLHVWGRANSINVQKVMWAASELGLETTRTDLAGAFGGNREPYYLAMNPNGLVPTIEDGPVRLWESNAIVRYLAHQYGQGTLEPSEPVAFGRAQQWMDWQITTLGPALTPGFWQIVRTPKEKQDAKVIETSRANSISAVQILDAQLGDTQYLAGDAFSMADIPASIFGYRIDALYKDRPPAPNFDRWFGAIRKRPGFKQHILDIPLT